MPANKRSHQDLREACLNEALKIIDAKGVEALSMREVARNLGVSHQAPYKHFESRDHILAEVVARAYDEFGNHLRRRSRSPDVDDEMMEMGLAYFDFALTHPLQYRLMFSTPLPNPTDHPAMMAKAGEAYDLLKESLSKTNNIQSSSEPGKLIELDAMFVWTVIHGLSSVLQSDAVETMQMDDETLKHAIPHILMRIGNALSSGPPDQAEITRKLEAQARALSTPPGLDVENPKPSRGPRNG